MACKVKYASSSGIMPREVKGIGTLAASFPSEWLLYVSLNCFPRNQSPMEIDAIVVMDTSLLLLEIKDWTGKLTLRGDCWYIDRQNRGRSAVVLVEEKAKKLRSVIKNQSPLAGAYFINSRVVLTGTADRSNLPAQEADRVLTLSESKALGDPATRKRLFPLDRVKLKKAYEFERDFDQIFLNSPKLFQASEADWAGFEVTEKNVFVHPRQVWQDHFAQNKSEPRLKGMVRTWSFDKLSPGLNTAETRKLVSIRETNVFAYLQDLGSELISRNRVLRQVNPAESEVRTNHFEVRNLHPAFSTLDRFLVRNQEQLNIDDRVVIATSLLTTVSQLHHARVAHRDLGPRSIWLRSHSDHALTGFMSCQLPDRGSVVDWLDELRGYSSSLPAILFSEAKTGFDRDIRSCTALVSLVLTGEVPQDNVASNSIDALPSELCNLEAWIKKGLMSADQGGFSDMMEALAEFSELVERKDAGTIDSSLLDRFETSTIPFVQWLPTGPVSQSITKAQYAAHHDGQDLQVKVWTSVRRNHSAAVDCALLRMLTSTEDLIRSPIHGLTTFVASGISSTGPFVVYERAAGIPLTEIQHLPDGIGLSLALTLLKAVAELHSRGCEHGDISPANCVVSQDTNSICLIDPFDISPIGDASVRTPAMCPSNWQTLSQYAIDRYAVIKVATFLLRAENNQFSDAALSGLAIELERPAIETLEMASAVIKRSLDGMRAPETLRLVLQTNEQTFGFGSQDTLYIRRAVERFILSSGKSQLVLLEAGSKLAKHWFKSIDFATLANESSSSYKDLPVNIEVQSGPTSGFEALYEYLSGLKQFAAPVQPVLRAEAPVDALEPWLDVASHWRHLIDLEEDARAEVQVTEVLSTTEATTYCKYENLGKTFDFDEDDQVEVHRDGWRIGSVDISESDFPNTIAINSPRNEVRQGERLRLVGRRDQASIDRRSRAVNRILEGKSSIPDLLNYFDGLAEIVPSEHEASVTDEDLRDTYQLNLGQREAFKRVLTTGPVGLLQGPPGTGKTRFIASLIHWLLTKGGAQRILVASQAHEAVNNAVEALLLLHKKQGTKPSLIRIGSKGITSRIRPYYTAELRERYRVRFEAAARFRFIQLTSALGIDREYSSTVFDLDKGVGAFARRYASARAGMESEQDALAIDKERNRVQLARLAVTFSEAYRSAAGVAPAGENPLAEYDSLMEERERRFSHIPPADRLAAHRALALTNDWLNSLGSPGRNFEEFLAKTRSVVAATCVGVGETRIRIDSHVFDWVIVDEAARCTPGELAVPIQVGRRVLLVGDHLQLPPMLPRDVVKRLREEDPDRKESDYLTSDFERSFTSTFGKAVGSTLTEQYRMDPQICSLVSECFYEPHKIRLSTSPDRPESTFPRSKCDQWLNTPIAWIDTAASSLRREWRREDESTTRNTAEVDAVVRVLEKLSEDATLVEYLASLEDETPVGVICMYSGQRDDIEASFARHAVSQSFRRMVRIDTVDSYQGKENAIVVLSLVRDNPYGDTGHVGRPNRCNVAVSRAIDRLIVVGSSQMWASRVPADSPMRRAWNYLQKHPASASIISAQELK
jgi:serine/threonine protein kinase